MSLTTTFLASLSLLLANGDFDVHAENANNHMSPHMRCDACLGIAHQLYESLIKAHNKLDRSKKALEEQEILEIVESACDKNFKYYGVKEVDGWNRISGPGIPHYDVSGLTQVDQWPQRLQEMCHDYIGEVDERDIYKVSLKGALHMIEYFCLGKGILGNCLDLGFKAEIYDLKNKDSKTSHNKPNLNQEENESYEMSQHMKCDACLGISYQFITSLGVKIKMVLSKEKKTLTENELLETIESTCNNNFKDYGLKQVNGWNRIAGPGIPHQEDTGKTQIGRWPHRLQAMCHDYVVKVGERNIYKVYVTSSLKLIEYLCMGKGLLGHCSNLKQLKTEL